MISITFDNNRTAVLSSQKKTKLLRQYHLDKIKIVVWILLTPIGAACEGVDIPLRLTSVALIVEEKGAIYQSPYGFLC